MLSSQPRKDDLTLQQTAIERARKAFARLPNGDVAFQRCIHQQGNVAEIITTVNSKYNSHRNKRSTRFLQRFQQYTTWLQNISGVVDMAVQVQAGIACPIWAPIKFILQVSDYHTQVTDQILDMLDMMSKNLPRFEIYEKLSDDHDLQTVLLDVFTSVVEYSVQVYDCLQTNVLVRATRLIMTPMKKTLGDAVQRLERSAKAADQTALATELLRAARFREEQSSRDRQDLKARCEAWLRSPDIRAAYHHLLQERVHGTCQWIWSNSSFVQWKNGPTALTAIQRLLYIHGKSGCGKSVLATSLTQAIRDQGHCVFLFSFSGVDSTRQTLECLARSFLWQMLQEINSDEALDIMRSLMAKGKALLSELWSVFGKLAAAVTKQVFWIIDGVDECKESSLAVFNQILGLMGAHEGVQVMLLGRPHAKTFNAPISHSIEITPALITHDIAIFIKAKVCESVLLQSSELSDTISTTLQGRSDGMFLWVKLMVDDLSKSSSKAEVTERLRALPNGLGEAYGQVLLRVITKLDRLEIKLAKCILSLAAISCRGLMLEELQYAQALAVRSRLSRTSDLPPLQDYFLENPVQMIYKLFKGLVSVTNGSVSLVHSSLKEFLIRPINEWSRKDDRRIKAFRIDFEESHQLIGTICQEYLEICNKESSLRDHNTTQALWKHYPFLEYSSEYVLHHVSQPGSSGFSERLSRFIESEALVPWVECLTAHYLEEGLIDSDLQEFEEKFMLQPVAGGQRETLMDLLRARMKQELFARKQTLGDIDPRTKQWELLSDILDIHLDRSDDNRIDVANSTHIEAPDAIIPEVSELVNIVRGGGSVPMPKQIDLLLRLQHQLMKGKVLTDPLKLVFRLLLKHAPAIPVYGLWGIAHFYYKLEKYQEEMEFYQAALAKLGNRDLPITYLIIIDAGDCLLHLRRYEEAEQMLREVYGRAMKTLGPRNRTTLKVVCQFTSCLMDYSGGDEEAESILRMARESATTALGKKDELTLRIVYRLGKCLVRNGKLDEAETLLRGVSEVATKSLGSKGLITLKVFRMLGECLMYQEKDQESESILSTALGTASTAYGPQHYHTISISGVLVELHLRALNFADAEKLSKANLCELRKKGGGKEWRVQQTMFDLAIALEEQEKHPEAENITRKLLEAVEADDVLPRQSILRISYLLGRTLFNQGQYEKAEAIYRGIVQEWGTRLDGDPPFYLEHLIVESISVLELSLERQEKWKEKDEMFDDLSLDLDLYDRLSMVYPLYVDEERTKVLGPYFVDYPLYLRSQ